MTDQVWLDESFEATNRAASIASWLRGFAVVIVVLGVLGAVAVCTSAGISESSKVSIVLYSGLSVGVAAAVLAAIGAALDLLRVQAQASLYTAGED